MLEPNRSTPVAEAADRRRPNASYARHRRRASLRRRRPRWRRPTFLGGPREPFGDGDDERHRSRPSEEASWAACPSRASAGRGAWRLDARSKALLDAFRGRGRACPSIRPFVARMRRADRRRWQDRGYCPPGTLGSGAGLDGLPQRIERQRGGAGCDLGEAHGAKAPAVHPDVDHAARAHPVVVDVAEEVERAAPRAVPSEGRTREIESGITAPRPSASGLARCWGGHGPWRSARSRRRSSRRMGRSGSGPARPMSWTPSASGSERHWTGPSPWSGTAKSLRPSGMGTQTTRTSGTRTRAGTETGGTGTGCENHEL